VISPGYAGHNGARDNQVIRSAREDSVTARRLLLVRHGETDFNREGRSQGHLDVPLNLLGMAQAEAIAARLTDADLVRCVSSDLLRARHTAEAVALPRGIPLDLTADLREAHLGVLQSQLIRDWGEVLGQDSDYLARLSSRARPPGGESPLDVRRRVQRFIRQLRTTLAGLPPGDVLIVGHGGSLRALLAVLLNLPPAAGWAFRFDNCALTVVDWRPGDHSQLLSFNDHAHLPG